jgi:2-polyprenyl-6-hydroxyphenyl methylase/3-demethylubiquinone-9 3-methyltransferase
VRGLFVCADVRRAPLADARAGVVLLADVLEHIEDRAAVLSEAARLLEPGGACFVSTINRTRRATWLAVHMAETIGLIPRGTHDPRLFVAPRGARRRGAPLRPAGRALARRVRGRAAQRARWAICLERSGDLSVGYSALLRKESPA